jgi:hypothetical protein
MPVMAEAARIREYVAELVPGLLQTPEYYRAFQQAAPAAGTEEEIERKIEVCLARRRKRQDHASWPAIQDAII